MADNNTYTLDNAFDEFCSRLEITDTQSDLAVQRHKAVRDHIEQNSPFEIEKTILYGSYARSTQIKPLNDDQWNFDVDVLVILNGSKSNIDKYYNSSGRSYKLLKDFYEFLVDYQKLEVEKDSPSISIKWQKPKMKVEITPAFRHVDGGFMVPNAPSWLSSYDWFRSDPLSDAAAISNGNQFCNGKLVPFIKMLKCWNRSYKEKIIASSFALETIAFYSATQTKFRTYDFEFRTFFNKLIELDEKTIPSPSKSGNDLKIHLSYGQIDSIKDTIKDMQRAYDLDKRGQHELAIAEMHKVFGNPFPTSPSG